IPEFDKGKHNHSEDGSDNNSIPDWVNSDDKVVQDTFRPHVNVATHEETPGKEDEPPKKVSEQKDSPLSGSFCDPKFPPGFTPLYSDHLEEVAANSPTSDRASVDHTSVQDKGVDNTISSNDGVNDFVLKDNSSNSTNHVSSSTNHDHVDSMTQATKPVNGFSILERFQDFITIGQAMGYGMKRCEKDYQKVIASMGDLNGWLLTLMCKGLQEVDLGVFYVVGINRFFKRKGFNLLIIAYVLKSYMAEIINRWHGEVIIMEDFNEVRYASERHGSIFHATNAAEFNTFIANSHLNDIPLGGYSFTWSDKYASKMSKLDRPILLKESYVDYGPTPFRLFYSWFLEQDFSFVVEYSWNNDGVTDTNAMILLKNKLKSLKVRLKAWSTEKKSVKEHDLKLLHDAIIDIDSRLDKAKIKWAIEGDENTKFYHGIVNKKRRHLAIKGVLVDGDWVDIRSRVKVEFYSHFAKRFSTPDWTLTNVEIKRAVWDCGPDKYPGPDGFTFEFFKKYWSTVGVDVINVVK
ncbi:RNA-directed DNA polymerase, eukaryota, partial [Tanacetum coccineum]